MNKQCKFCIHGDVCAYKEHYKDAVELYEKAKYECSKYPYFVCDIRCIKYLKKVEPQESEGDACKDCDYNDGKVHTECVVCETGWVNPLPFICDYVGCETKATTKEH